MLDVACPSCGEKYHVAESHLGRSLRCRRCDRVFEISAPRGAPSSAATTSGAGRSPANAPEAASTATSTAASTAAPVTVTDQDFEQRVLRSPQPVVVDFWAAWCGPCRAIAPAVEQLAQEYGGRVTFAKLNADENPRSMMQYGVQGIPTLILFKGGREAGRLVGLQPKAAIKRAVDQIMAA